MAIAEKEYPWGWFQFPRIGVDENGVMSVEWQMKNDSAEDYGDSAGLNNCKISYDNGKTWLDPYDRIEIPTFREQVHLDNGDILAISTQESENISTIDKMPSPEFSYGERNFYYEKDLPDKLKGIYINYFSGNIKKTFQAKVENPNLLRYSLRGSISTFWFGKLGIRESSIYACVYPTYYTDEQDNLMPTAISFYKSSNSGHSWNLQGIINYQVEAALHSESDFNNKGFSEPTFEFLNNDEILCVMRTTSNSITPMYKSYSYDYGREWSTPEPITPNGVMPQLIRLDNDILILASGRPGIQLRFCCDGKGDAWTSPVELIDYDEEQNWVYDTCGYPFLYKSSDNEFYIVYSNFQEKSSSGEKRKSIIFRRIKITRV